MSELTQPPFDTRDDPPPGSSSRLLEWRVLLSPLDDWSTAPTPEHQQGLIDACVAAFRARLEDSRRRGELVMGYGPVGGTR